MREKIEKFSETNKNRDTTYQNIWYSMKVVLRVKFIALSAYIKKSGFQINKIMLHLKTL